LGPASEDAALVGLHARDDRGDTEKKKLVHPQEVEHEDGDSEDGEWKILGRGPSELP
jgi:hypothetical protein